MYNIRALATYLYQAKEDLDEGNILHEAITACLKPSMSPYVIAETLRLLDRGKITKVLAL